MAGRETVRLRDDARHRHLEGAGALPRSRRLEREMGFVGSYNFVPERYHVREDLRDYLTGNGFEVGVHGLKHDGKYYNSRKIFQGRSRKINRYIKDWDSVGFRSPSMLHNLDWLHALDIEYDASTFDTDPFEPQPDGVGTIFPFWVPSGNGTDRLRGDPVHVAAGLHPVRPPEAEEHRHLEEEAGLDRVEGRDGAADRSIPITSISVEPAVRVEEYPLKLLQRIS